MAKKKILFLSTYPPRECGIATFTKDLSDAVRKKFGNIVRPAIMAVNESESSLYRYGKNVKATLTQDEIASYEKAARKINSMRSISIVNIQHEFGLFGGEYGSHILRFMELVDKKIVTTLHTVLDEPTHAMKEVVKGIFARSDMAVVMTQTAKSILHKQYGVDPEKVVVIPHGVPGMRFEKAEKIKRKYGIKNRNVIVTFGLLSRGKGIEHFISSVPKIIEKHPDTLYLVVGQTHPRVREQEGESYRVELKGLAERLGIAENVKFLDKFLTLDEIKECLCMASIYASPSLDPQQICSGTVSYAMGAGKAIISSTNKYNSEVLASERGIIIGRPSSKRFAQQTIRLLDDENLRKRLERNAFEYSRKMTWPNVSTQYFNAFAGLSQLDPEPFSRLPRISFRHFSNMTDEFGIVQFANYSKPDIESGYTLDDNARALAVAVMGYERYGTKKMLKFADTFLGFVEKCQLHDGGFHNIVDGSREFSDDVGSEDSFGRAVWALGRTLKSALPEEYRLRAKKMLEKAIPGGNEIESPRAQADTLIGLVSSREYFNGEITPIKERLVDSLVSKYVEASDGGWKWFEGYLTYGNSRIPEALFDAHGYDKSGLAAKIARESIDFLTKTLFIGGKLVPIGQDKWYVKGMERSLYDQQPIEAAGMTTAYLKAFEKTSDSTYLKKARASFDWFLGKNSMNQVVYDEATGGCFDGLTPNGVNANEGAESTVSYLYARLSIT